MKYKSSDTKIQQHKMNQDKLLPTFSHLLRHPACKRSGPVLQGEDKGEVSKKCYSYD